MIPRLYVTGDLSAGAAAESEDVHYLRSVLRLAAGAEVELFNGRDGGWRGRIVRLDKKAATIGVERQVAEQAAVPDLMLMFAPLKKTRIDFLVEKATELGVRSLWPVFTDHAITDRVNERRLSEIAREAAEQSGRLSVPEVRQAARLRDTLDVLEKEGRRLFVADETGGGISARAAFAGATIGPAAILIGPEGGFSAAELDLVRRLDIVTAIDLGSRILRAETAAVAALACFQALCGDWES
ncbi:MAG: 16S rRNA (uracil(1498)-N(3))-methyltransferase [Alphaproteobacteria bacterium]